MGIIKENFKKSWHGALLGIIVLTALFLTQEAYAQIVTIQLPTEYVDGRPIASTLALTIWYGTSTGTYTVEEPVGAGFTPGGTIEYETLFGCDSNYYIAATATDELDGSTSGFSNEINYMPLCTFQPTPPTILNVAD